jgi:signal transduction histidine kinase
MMETRLLCAEIRYEPDVVLVRQRARQLAGLLRFDAQDQARIATSVSEIARNAFAYAGGGLVSFGVTGSAYVITIADRGPGIPDLEAILEGRYQSTTGMGLGIVGARRLMHGFEITSGADGTTVTLRMDLPPASRGLSGPQLAALGHQLAAVTPHDPLGELQARNQELLRALEELRLRQHEVERLNGELAETNRGVLALYAELDDRALQLGRASELKSSFLSSISHELRTPLNAIHNLTRLLLDRMDGELTAGQEHQVRLIRDAAASLTDIVNDLLDLARIEAGKTVLRLSEFSVAEMLGTLRGMLRPLIAGDAVALTVEQADPGLMMASDEGKVSQVLRNLVSNAVKFTPQGEIRLTVEVDRSDDSVVFSVSDTGIGIAPADLDRIFEEYAQVDSPLQRHATGTGLGLPLSRKLASLLGGSLTAASTPGQGSTFTLRLPRVHQPPTQASGRDAPIEAGAGAVHG